jgi:serine/threonine protein kinase
MLIGTVAYMSPEQIKAETVSSASDIFSLGVIFYEMATGRRPFKGGAEVAVMYKIVYDEPPAPATLAAELPRSLDALILRMLVKNPRSAAACSRGRPHRTSSPRRRACRWRRARPSAASRSALD